MQKRGIISFKAEKKDLKGHPFDCYGDKSENIENQSTSCRDLGDNCFSEDSNHHFDLPHVNVDENRKFEGENFSCTCCSDDLLGESESLWTWKNIFVIVASATIILIGLYFNYFTDMKWLATILFLIVISFSGYEIIKSGIRGLLKGNISMNLLMTIAVAVSFAIGSGAEGAVIIFLFYIAEFLEDYAGSRARKSMEKLLKLAPDTATVKRNGETVELNVGDVKLGDILVVRPGEKIPLDGAVIKGVSTVNQATITGESMPITKTKGSNVFAATLNEEGYLEVRITKKSGETVLSRIIELVRESQKRKSNTEAFIERFVKYYTPAVVAIATAVALVPPLVFGQLLYTWVYRALVLLVISCPCAFLLSTPVAMVSGITSGTRNGVLIKGSRYVEEMKNINTVVFDKTGTLTEGKLEVIDVISMNNYSKQEVLQIAGSLEYSSKHPLAEAIKQHVKELNINFKDVKDFKSITGKGVKGEVDEKTFYIGKESLFNNIELTKLTGKLEDEGKTVVLVGSEDQVIGLIGLMDRIRPISKNTISGLKKRNIKTLMLTGDNQGTAKAVSSSLGFDEYYACLLPEDKVKIIEDLLDKGEKVAMVGDGVNDAPALARANVGIAMGAAGSDVAIETADVALMQDNIGKINYFIDLSRKTMAVVKQNVMVALLIQLALATFAVFGFVPLWVAVTLGDVGLTVAVILNALRVGSMDDDFDEGKSHDLLLDDKISNPID